MLQRVISHIHKCKFLSGEIPVIQLNFVALSYELNMDRDFVEASIKEVVNALSRAIEQTGSAEFGLTTVGNLVIQNGVAKMKFLPSFIEQIDQTGGLARYLSKVRTLIKGTVMQTEKALTNDHLCVSKVF